MKMTLTGQLPELNRMKESIALMAKRKVTMMAFEEMIKKHPRILFVGGIAIREELKKEEEARIEAYRENRRRMENSKH